MCKGDNIFKRGAPVYSQQFNLFLKVIEDWLGFTRAAPAVSKDGIFTCLSLNGSGFRLSVSDAFEVDRKLCRRAHKDIQRLEEAIDTVHIEASPLYSPTSFHNFVYFPFKSFNRACLNYIFAFFVPRIHYPIHDQSLHIYFVSLNLSCTHSCVF